MLKIPFLRNIFLSTLLGLLGLALYVFLVVFPDLQHLLVANTEEEAVRVSSHLAAETLGDSEQISAEMLANHPELQQKLDAISKELGIWKHPPAGCQWKNHFFHYNKRSWKNQSSPLLPGNRCTRTPLEQIGIQRRTVGRRRSAAPFHCRDLRPAHA